MCPPGGSGPRTASRPSPPAGRENRKRSKCRLLTGIGWENSECPLFFLFGHSRCRLKLSNRIGDLPAMSVCKPTALVARKPGVVGGPSQKICQRLRHWRVVVSCTSHLIFSTPSRSVSEGTRPESLADASGWCSDPQTSHGAIVCAGKEERSGSRRASRLARAQGATRRVELRAVSIGGSRRLAGRPPFDAQAMARRGEAVNRCRGVDALVAADENEI